MYDQREKVQRDYLAAIEGARKEGLEEGLDKGLKEGIKKGLKEGLDKGEMVGKIELLEQLVGEDRRSKQQLRECSVEELSARLAELQEQLRSRGE